MGLVNIFNIQRLRPHINYRFSAEIWPNAAEGDRIEEYTKFQYTIKKITQPVYKLDTENKKVYGNTAYVVPIFKYGETSLEITFEETDKMEVFKQLCTWMGPNLYKGYLPPLINIRVTQFNESMADVVDKKVYICRLKEHGMPSFNNNGFGSPIEITATFNVVYVMDEPLTLEHYNDNNEISRYTTEYTLPDNKALNDALKETLKNHKNADSADKVLKAERKLADKRIDELANENLDLNEYMMERLAVAYAKSMENASPEKRALMQQIAESKGGSTMANQTEILLNFLNANVRAEHGEKTKESVAGADYELIAFNAANGADNYETEAIERFLKFTNADEETVAEISDILYKMNENVARIDDLNKPITDADELAKKLQKDYPTEDDLKRAIKEAVGMEVDTPKKSVSKKETIPQHTYNGNDPLLGAVSYSYEKEVTAKEGERGHVFFDMLDAGGARGTINLGSGSSEGARGYSDVGEITVNINGVTMQFKDSASLNAAVQKAFGGKEAIVNVFLENGGGKGYTTKEERKKADLKGAKEGLNQLLEASGGVITDDYGNTSVVKLDKGKGIYLNIQLDEDSSQRVSNKNMSLDTKGWSESTKQTVINSNEGSANKTVQGMLHFEHAYSGFKSVWNQFNKDESNVQMLNEDIKRGTFSQATLDELSRSVDKLNVSEKTKKSFKRVIKEYGYLS